MPACINHDNIEGRRKRLGHRSPAQAVIAHTVGQHKRRQPAAGARVV